MFRSIKIFEKCMCCTSSAHISLPQGEPGKAGEKGLLGRTGLRVSHVPVDVHVQIALPCLSVGIRSN